MSEPFVAEIRILPYTFAPTGWAYCEGQLLPISQNTALFSLLGTNYGGDGKSTFALPDIRGRAPMHPGQGPGLTSRSLAEKGGSDSVTLTTDQMPQHAHVVNVLTTPAAKTAPEGAELAATRDNVYGTPGLKRLVALDSRSVGTTGGDQPHNNMQPYLSLHFAIALFGIFPPRG
ncbi:MAG TPA: tail fiber protein [Candidatus Limnocylindria bacterium]|jgi:microcystin-dependent protein|nr:tail fiber protein [Candidatus Limnocylindria bacterium]